MDCIWNGKLEADMNILLNKIVDLPLQIIILSNVVEKKRTNENNNAMFSVFFFQKKRLSFFIESKIKTELQIIYNFHVL